MSGCTRGHALEDVYVRPGGKPECRGCRRERQKRSSPAIRSRGREIKKEHAAMVVFIETMISGTPCSCRNDWADDGRGWVLVMCVACRAKEMLREFNAAKA